MKTLALSTTENLVLPKMGIMTQITELSRHDYIYVKHLLSENISLLISEDKSRYWDANALAVFYKHFKIGYLNPSIAKMVKRIMVKYGGITAELKHKSSNSLPFEYVDIILKIG